MKKFVKVFVVIFFILCLNSCVSTKVVDVKSPCVSGEDGPCGPRKPVNTWLNEYRV